MPGKKYRLICFDADGTLFDYNRAEEWALKNTFLEHNLAFSGKTIETYRKINKSLWDRLEQGNIKIERLKIERFTKTFPGLSEKEALELSKTYLEHLKKTGFLISGAEETIRALHGKYKLILLTNGLAKTQEGRLRASGLYAYFDAVITSEEAGCAKPDERIFRMALSIAKVISRESLMVGDNLTADIKGALMAGMDACWYNPLYEEKNKTEEYLIIKNLKELLNFLL
ncbi:YjjG family noncanonical pyrimidine nucleotidase [Spirochaetia bacterium 38H-sp]|uniref:YjjG family noncanonical pyrimidine nucleotidase n=1 Tax=Rarispira pelagica TaxID=3141764 RepID=A0ABU9U9H1_9SPIR